MIWTGVLAVLLSFKAAAQQLDVIELGNIMGEMKNFKSALTWVNTTEDTLRFKLWSNREDLSFEKSTLVLAPGDTTVMNYSIALENTSGPEAYEVRLVGQEEIVLHGFLLKARVFEAEEEVFKAYRNDFFPFRATEQVFNLKRGFRGDQLTGQFNLYNFGGSDLDLQQVFTSMPGVGVSFEPRVVPHHSFTRLTVTLYDSRLHDLGFTREKMVMWDANSTVIATVPVQFTLEQAPRSATNGPHMALSQLSHDFRVIEEGDYESVNITVTNTGQSPLSIHKLESNCQCLEYELDATSLEQGESANLKVSFNAKGRQGYERKTLALFTNDPEQPTRVLTFRAHVK
jgi:hypothetical protein